jgi:hypothetical protein
MRSYVHPWHLTMRSYVHPWHHNLKQGLLLFAETQAVSSKYIDHLSVVDMLLAAHL